ncbi:PC-esterase domain-containing protein 1A-like [Octodon degus]|uniref:PC-esterase domain-containing protein 1A-like n=1 Tax=Octodon degus TaxID=10160 RepID=A0A6P3V9U6_OCTDE|nr:PC-esterase domain-containing protein 1A-like [Octodon degus]
MTHLRTREVRQLLHNKFVVVMGDSIQRTVYKDLVLLLQKNRLLSSGQLEAKGELSFERDVLLDGGSCSRTHNDIYYREVRQFCSGHHLVRFYFLTRAYSAYLEDVLSELRRGEHAPDLVVLNSCLWDVSRHGRHFPSRYREDLECLFRRMDRVLPDHCLLVWNTALPVADVVADGFLPPAGPASSGRLREDVIEANFYSSVEAARRGFDLLDLHFHFRHAAQHRLRDGLHWDERAHRRMSQLLLAHVADAWGVNLPPRRAAHRRPERPRHAGHGGRVHPRDPAASRRSGGPARLEPRASAPSDAPPQESAPLLSDAPPQPGPNLSNSVRSLVEYYRKQHSRVGREPVPGPMRRADSQDRPRASPPYPPERSAGSQERHPQHRPGSRQTQHTEGQGTGSQPDLDLGSSHRVFPGSGAA